MSTAPLILLLAMSTLGYQGDPIVLAPGIGLVEAGNSKSHAYEVVLFEHTEVGTGGLVLNCPTPLRLKAIPVERYQPFGHLPLMLGCGLNDGGDDDDELGGSVPLTEMAPWFWLHNLPNIPGSYELAAASGPLFMGGNLDMATKYLHVNNLDPAGRFQFFRKYKSWGPGELEGEIKGGMWTSVGPQLPERALRVF